MKATARIEVGRLRCGPVRDYLWGAERLRGIEWNEGPGWFSRIFTIYGDLDQIQQIITQLDQWANVESVQKRVNDD